MVLRVRLMDPKVLGTVVAWDVVVTGSEGGEASADPTPPRARQPSIERRHTWSEDADVLKDLRLAIRGLGASPGFTTIAVVTLALGIGASTAIFSVVNGVLLRSLPYPNPDNLMQVATVNQYGRPNRLSYPDFEDLREQNESFAELAAYSDWTTSAAAADRGFLVHWAQVSRGFFSVLGVEPAAGRLFSDDEERTGRHVAVVSYGYWRRRLRAIGSLANQSVRVGDDVYAVIGVIPDGYEFPAETELWVPREPAVEGRTAHNWSAVGRLRDDISPALAQQDLSRVARSIKQRYGDDTDTVDAFVRPVLEQLVGGVRPALTVLLGGAGIVLLVACVNVANLLLARAFSRDRESALRLALGAGPVRLGRAFLTESLLLSLLGAALGVLIALAGVPALLELQPGLLPRAGNVGVEWPVLAFALAIALIVALMIGVVPAVRAARRDTREVLAGSRRILGGGTASRRVRATLAASQIALTVVLLVAAGLVGRTILGLLAVDPGFRTEGALVMDVWLPYPDMQDPAPGGTRIASFLERLTAGLRTIPGVERVGGVNHFPLEGGGPNGTFVVLERPDEISSFEDFLGLVNEPARTGNAEFRVASTGYFGAMGIPLIRGRLFDQRDTAESPHVAVISASLAATRWPGQNPLGKLIFFGNMDSDLRPFTVVGVVGDVQEYGLGRAPLPTFYADLRQRPRTAAEFHIAITGSSGTADLIPSARRLARSLDPEMPVDFAALGNVVHGSFAERSFLLLLLSVFGTLALVLATAGVYGVIAYIALERTPEIGVRMALGAGSRDVARMLVWRSARFAIAGIVVGLLAAFAMTRMLVGFLYGVGTADPLTFAAAAAVVLAAALGAGWFPAHRASLTDPVEALRHE